MKVLRARQRALTAIGPADQRPWIEPKRRTGTGGPVPTVVTPIGAQVGNEAVAIVNLSIAGNFANATGYRADGIPPGLQLSSVGVFYGTPTTRGVYAVSVWGENGAGRSPNNLFGWTISA